MTRPVALSIAGSDSGGGAGLQADLRTFSALGAFGTTAVTALTAQNLGGVSTVMGVPPDLVQAQVRAVLDGFEVRAAKTGMLWSAETVLGVAELATAINGLVVDPVMVATSGARLLKEDAIEAYRSALLPRASVATPNLDEAAVLLEVDLIGRDQMHDVARELSQRFSCSTLLKGGHLQGDPLDVLWHDGELVRWEHPRIQGVNTHGSGCILSAAVAAYLARGASLVDACGHGLAFVRTAFERPLALRDGTRLAGIEAAGGPGAP